MKIQTVYIPKLKGNTCGLCHNHDYTKTEAFVFTPEELKQVLSNAWNDGRNGTEFTGNFPFTSNRYVNHSPEEYIDKLLNKL